MGAKSKQKKADKKRFLPAMETEAYNRLLHILWKRSTSENVSELLCYVYTACLNYGVKVSIDEAGNLLAEKGSGARPYIVSHLDTVHAWAENFKIYKQTENKNRLILSARNGDKSVGIGGDDKCGVFIALECLRKYENICAAFFVGEESGCLGSGDVKLSFFNDANFVLQFDRYGASDLITSASGVKLCSESFIMAINAVMHNYGFKEAKGLMTDVLELKERGLNVSCVNVSCGYYLHHTEREYIDVNELNNALLFCFAVIDSVGSYRFEHKAPERKSYVYNNASAYNYNMYAGVNKLNINGTTTYFGAINDDNYCDFCGSWLKNGDELKRGYCTRCYNELTDNGTNASIFF